MHSEIMEDETSRCSEFWGPQLKKRAEMMYRETCNIKKKKFTQTISCI